MKYFLILIIIFHFSDGFAQPDPIDFIKSIGFTPVNQDLPNIQNKDLDGNFVDTTNFKGSFVLLNFWATWCGFCKKELPSLESLYVEFKNTKLKIIGVSVDQGSDIQVKKFVKQNSISFPIIHDSIGEISKYFDASSVPVHYLISPDLKIVGVLRGAINWEDSKIINSLRELVKINSVDTSKLASTVSRSTETPPLASPQISSKIVNNELHVSLILGENASDYLIKVPKVTLPPEITFSNVSTSSQAGLDKTVLDYIFYLNIKKNASYSIGPIEVKYSSIYGGEEMIATHPGISYDYNTTSDNKLIYGLLSLCGLIFLIILFIFKKSFLNTKNKNTSSNSLLDLKTYMRELSSIKMLKMSGENQEYQKKLVTLYQQVLNLTNNQDEKLGQLIEEISYGGKKLEAAEIINIEKKLDRIINQDKFDEI